MAQVEIRLRARPQDDEIDVYGLGLLQNNQVHEITDEQVANFKILQPWVEWPDEGKGKLVIHDDPPEPSDNPTPHFVTEKPLEEVLPESPTVFPGTETTSEQSPPPTDQQAEQSTSALVTSPSPVQPADQSTPVDAAPVDTSTGTGGNP